MDMEKYGISRTGWETLINEWIFSERDRALVKRRILDGICFECLAEEFCLSVQQTKTIVYRSKDILLQHI